MLRLRLVTFRYRPPVADGSNPLQYGLVAEEVAAVVPELVVCDPAGEPAGSRRWARGPDPWSRRQRSGPGAVLHLSLTEPAPSRPSAA